MEKINESAFCGGIGAGFDNTLSPASYNVQGSPTGYSYHILPVTDVFQQKGNRLNTEFYIYPGCNVRGVGVNNKDLHYSGVVHRVVKREDGSILCLYIKTFKNNKFVSIRADENLELLIYHPKQIGIQKLQPESNMKI